MLFPLIILLLLALAFFLHHQLSLPRRFYLNVRVLSADDAELMKAKPQQAPGGKLAHKSPGAKASIEPLSKMAQQLRDTIVAYLLEKTSADGFEIALYRAYMSGPYFVLMVSFDRVNLRKLFAGAPDPVITGIDTLPPVVLAYLEKAILPGVISQNMVRKMGQDVTTRARMTGLSVSARAVLPTDQAQYFYEEIAMMES